jgi:ADP-ribose pyrophosphatase YjhB (NUDIX family)
MPRHTRYQGAIIRDHHILLIMHREHESGRTYWLVPGGGMEDGESEEQCVIREMKEETNLDVTVERLLFEEDGIEGGFYKKINTYLCRADHGEPMPGYEPEESASSFYGIIDVRWFDLRQPETWGALVKPDPFTYPLLKKIQAALGYPVAGEK